MAKKKQNKWKERIKASQDYKCACCKQKFEPRELQIHHMKNKCKGGLSNKENCVACCVACHIWIHEIYGNNYCDPR
ncbi:TPA: hypothetical protein DEP90_02810 [Patescibacteria group bacterium]|nr:hypothetical protein [Patescibacteria group bacterium]